MAVQGGIAVLAAVTIFPESVGHAFQGKLVGVLDPLRRSMQSVEQLFEEVRNEQNMRQHDNSAVIDGVDPDDALDVLTDRASAIRAQLLQSLAGVPPLRAQQRYLSVNFSYSRLSGHDLREL